MPLSWAAEPGWYDSNFHVIGAANYYIQVYQYFGGSMGYRIESYTLEELQKVSLPGWAATALFWVIPLGQWPAGTLDGLWWMFTRGDGACTELGLLLVKNAYGRPERKYQNGNLSALVASGNLAEILPKGAAQHAAIIPDPRQRGFLICSGAYPQPGWGLWVSAEKYSGENALDEMLERVLLDIQLSQEARATIRDAADNWKTLDKIKQGETTGTAGVARYHPHPAVRIAPDTQY